jgi:hypothetical protein
MHIVWGVLAGALLGVAVGIAVLFWHVEHADGNLASF